MTHTRLVCYALVVVFAGKTTITATVNGEPVSAPVSINGQPRGSTPYSSDLGPGTFDIEVLPPPDWRTHESKWTGHMVTFGVGQDIRADFTSSSKQKKK